MKDTNEIIEALYKTIDAQNKTINEQALEISQLKEQKKQAIECIKNRNTKEAKKERFMNNISTLEKVLEILGDKENE